jgi:hypothetical protein
MAGLELVEFNAMIIAIIALINFPFIVKRRKDFIKYLPGILLLVLAFIAENIEEIYVHDLSAILENVFLLSGAILLIMAILMELDIIFIKIKHIRLNKKKRKKLKLI